MSVVDTVILRIYYDLEVRFGRPQNTVMTYLTPINAGRGIGLVTTPYRDSSKGIEGFLQCARALRAADPRICCIAIAMPSRTNENVRRKILQMLGAGEYLGEMSPAAQGVGPLFHFAMEFLFRLWDKADAVIHLPIDVDWGNPHEGDVQGAIARLAAILGPDEADLVLGDYAPGSGWARAGCPTELRYCWRNTYARNLPTTSWTSPSGGSPWSACVPNSLA